MNRPLSKLITFLILLLTLGVSLSCKNSYWDQDNAYNVFLKTNLKPIPN